MIQKQQHRANVNAELHARLHQVEVNARDLGARDTLGHGLGSNTAVERVSVNEPGVLSTASVRLQHVDTVDWVLHLALI
jgi:hypothetical protein